MAKENILVYQKNSVENLGSLENITTLMRRILIQGLFLYHDRVLEGECATFPKGITEVSMWYGAQLWFWAD